MNASPFDDIMAKVAGGGGGGGDVSNPASIGSGPPPSPVNPLPPPTGIGAKPTGSSGAVDKKGAISEAVLALREVMGYVPSQQTQLQSCIDALLKEASNSGPPGDVSSPSGPGAAATLTDPNVMSGSPGAQ